MGLQIACSFILRIPGETAKDMEATLQFAKKLDPDWYQFNIYVAVPGSGLYDEVLQKGLYDRMDGFLVYVKTEEFNYESLQEIQRKFQTDCDLSPKRILRKIRREGVVTVLKKSRKYFCN